MFLFCCNIYSVYTQFAFWEEEQRRLIQMFGIGQILREGRAASLRTRGDLEAGVVSWEPDWGGWMTRCKKNGEPGNFFPNRTCIYTELQTMTNTETVTIERKGYGVKLMWV